jgi:putative endonuclease
MILSYYLQIDEGWTRKLGVNMKKELGRYGEQRAAQYLERHGYTIISRNYYTRYGELDIVCQKQGEIIFVEVKTRKTKLFGSPEESITYKKMQNIKKAALKYLHDYPAAFRGLRFDVITIFIDYQGRENINHIENAF